jgi:hypothetical protein
MRKGANDTTTTDAETLFDASFNMSQRSTYLNDEVHSGKKYLGLCADYAPQVPDYQDFWILRCHITRICTIIHTTVGLNTRTLECRQLA